MTLFDSDGKPKDPTPAKLEALILADAIYNIFVWRISLEEAKKSIPHYTGGNSDESYYSYEQEKYNHAADSLYELLKL